MQIISFVEEILLAVFVIFLVLSSLFFLAIQLLRHQEPQQGYRATGRALVMIPCKGIDLTLDKTFSSLKEQDYDNYEIVCIVDSETDPSVEYIRRSGLRFITSNYRCNGCSGKVRALCTALHEFRDFDIYVIGDSDIIANSNWLRTLISPLSDESVGLATTFPLFVPQGGFWSQFKSVWGMVGHSMMKSNRTRFGWGGSLAFRKDLINDSMDQFCASVSDDIALSKICAAKGKRIEYMQKATPDIVVNENFSSFMEWANRQVALSVSSGNNVLKFGLAYFIGQSFLIVSAVVLSIFLNPVFLLLLVPFVTQSIRYRKYHGKLGFFVPLIEFLLPFIYTYNLLHSVTHEEIQWRGSVYNLRGGK